MNDNNKSEPVKRHKRGDVREDGKLFWGYSPRKRQEIWLDSADALEERRTREYVKAKAWKAKAVVVRGSLKRGTVREDGKVFMCYQKGCKNSEWWVTPEQFEEARQRSNAKRVVGVISEEQRLKNVAAARAYARKLDPEVKKERRRRQSEKWMNDPEREAKLAAARAAAHAKDPRPPVEDRILVRGDVRDSDGLIFWAYDITQFPDGELWLTQEKFDAMKEQFRGWRNARYHARKVNDPMFKAIVHLRGVVKTAFRRKRFARDSKTAEILGVTWDEAKKHIESQFEPWMSWSNVGEWHTDHIIPMKYARDVDEATALCHISNLRPMEAKANIRRKARLPDKSEVPAALLEKFAHLFEE